MSAAIPKVKYGTRVFLSDDIQLSYSTNHQNCDDSLSLEAGARSVYAVSGQRAVFTGSAAELIRAELKYFLFLPKFSSVYGKLSTV